MSVVDQQQAALMLRQLQFAVRNNQEEQREDEEMGQSLRQAQQQERGHLARSIEAISSGNEFEVAREAVSLGMDLRRRINDADFSGSTFYTVLFLSILGDLGSLLSIFAVGYLLDKFVAIALFFVFFLKVSFIKKYLVKRFIWPVIAKFLPPPFDMFPTYTISTIMLKLKLDRVKADLNSELKQVESAD